MRQILRILALLLTAGAIVVWLVTGAKIGWTTTQKEVRTLDPVTEIEGISYEKKFTAGVDFLGAAFLGGGVLAGLSFLFRPKPNQLNP